MPFFKAPKTASTRRCLSWPRFRLHVNKSEIATKAEITLSATASIFFMLSVWE